MEILTIGTGSSGNAYIMTEDDGSMVLLDAGMSLKAIKQAINFDISKIKFCLVTHEHKDHCLAVPDLIDNGIPVISSFTVRNKIDNRLIPLVEGAKTDLFGHTITPFYVPHTSIVDGQTVECKNFAFYIIFPNGERMVYATDFEYLPYTMKKQRVSHWLIEANYIDFSGIDENRREHVLKGHAGLQTVIGIVRENWTPYMRNVILCHLSAENANAEIMKKQVQLAAGDTVKVSVAEPGKTIVLDSAHIDWEV